MTHNVDAGGGRRASAGVPPLGEALDTPPPAYTPAAPDLPGTAVTVTAPDRRGGTLAPNSHEWIVDQAIARVESARIEIGQHPVTAAQNARIIRLLEETYRDTLRRSSRTPARMDAVSDVRRDA